MLLKKLLLRDAEQSLQLPEEVGAIISPLPICDIFLATALCKRDGLVKYRKGMQGKKSCAWGGRRKIIIYRSFG